MRGNLNFDFVIALAMFATAYMLVFSSISPFAMGFRAYRDPVESDARYLSDMLLSQPGVPETWSAIEGENVRLGLSLYNRTNYQNIIDLKKAKAIGAAQCSSLKPRSDSSLNFKIRIETDTGGPYECAGDVPKGARLITRSAKVARINASTSKPVMEYNQSLVKIWVWMG